MLLELCMDRACPPRRGILMNRRPSAPASAKTPINIKLVSVTKSRARPTILASSFGRRSSANAAAVKFFKACDCASKVFGRGQEDFFENGRVFIERFPKPLPHPPQARPGLRTTFRAYPHAEEHRRVRRYPTRSCTMQSKRQSISIQLSRCGSGVRQICLPPHLGCEVSTWAFCKQVHVQTL
jgi:hypothetical protein